MKCSVEFVCEREYQRGDEVPWYADKDKLVWNEYNPATLYVFGTISGVEDDVIGKYNDKGVFIFWVFLIKELG
ncbi:hypothetical protein Hanom_Chr04g00337481 [Helianthus anomalus]